MTLKFRNIGMSEVEIFKVAILRSPTEYLFPRLNKTKLIPHSCRLATWPVIFGQGVGPSFPRLKEPWEGTKLNDCDFDFWMTVET
jgi:hypothetical protein